MSPRPPSTHERNGILRCLKHVIPITLICVIGWAVNDARAGHFLPHKHHMTVPQKVAYFRRSIRHDRQQIRWFLSRRAPRTLERVTELGWTLHALKWHRSLLALYSSKLLPSPREYAGACLAAIIDREDPGWSPTRWNTQGSGAYGLPQALPGSKMASAGADWATNPYTQILWMKSYTAKRYGGECAALSWWNGHGSY